MRSFIFRIGRLLFAVLLAFSLFVPISAYAYEKEDYIGKFEELLPDEKYAEPDRLESLFSLPEALESLGEEISSAFSALSPHLLTLLGITVLSYAVSLYQGRCREAVLVGAGLVSTLVSYSTLCDMAGNILSSLGDVTAFFSTLIPLLSSVTLAGGGSYTAAAPSLAMASTAALFSGVITPLFTILFSMTFALSLLSSVGGESLSSLIKGIKRTSLLLLSTVGAVIIGTVSLQGLITSSRDNAALRTARQLAGSLIPVVGQTVSSSLSVLWSGLSLARGTIGVGGLAVILGMLLSPLLSLLIYRLFIALFRGAEGLLGMTSPLSGVAECLDLLIGVYSISSVVYIFEIVLFIKGGASVL